MQGEYDPWALDSFLSGGLEGDLLARTCSKFDRASPSPAVERAPAVEKAGAICRKRMNMVIRL